MDKLSANLVFTTSIKPCKDVLFILNDLKHIFSDSVYLKRKTYKLRQIIAYLKLKKVKNLVLLTQNPGKFFDFWHLDLENDFSVKYQITSIILRKSVENCGKISLHSPELFFNNFKGNINCVLGSMMKRFFIRLPEFKGRQILSFFKRKRYIFIRFHRYIFSATGKDVKIQELGPKITLKFQNFFNLIDFKKNFL